MCFLFNGIRMNPAQLQQILADCDFDHDGRFTFDEFWSVVQTVKAGWLSAVSSSFHVRVNELPIYCFLRALGASACLGETLQDNVPPAHSRWLALSTFFVKSRCYQPWKQGKETNHLGGFRQRHTHLPVGQSQWYHFVVGAPPILEPILVVGLECSLGVRALDSDPSCGLPLHCPASLRVAWRAAASAAKREEPAGRCGPSPRSLHGRMAADPTLEAP